MNLNLIKTKLTFAESMSFVNGCVDTCFTQDEEGNDIDYSAICKIPAIKSAFVEYFTDHEFGEDFDDNYEFYMEVKPSAYLSNDSLTVYEQLLTVIDEQIEFRKQKMIYSQRSAMDEMLNQVSTLLSTLNSKAEQLDIKKLDKMISKLTPNAVVKAYQKSNIGDVVRDKAIQDLSKENKELKNKVTARNVLAK